MEQDITLKNTNKWAVFILVAVGVFMSTLDGSIVNIALPTIMKELGVNLPTTQWVVTMYLLTVSALLLSLGRLSDIIGRRRVYGRGLWIFSVGSLCCGMAKGAFWLIGARCLQGVGAAMIMACTPALIVDTFPAAERGRALGMVGTVVACGLTTGPVLGGALLHLFSWRAIFYINVPVGIVTAITISKLLKNTSADCGRTEPFDWNGSILLAFSALSTILVLSHGYMWGRTSLLTLGFGALSIVATAFFLWREANVASPILDLGLFTTRLFAFPLLSALALFISVFFVMFLMPFYLSLPCNFPVHEVGLIMVTPFVFLFFVSPFSGAAYDRFGSRALCTVGMGILALALFFLSRLNGQADTFHIVWRLALMGVGIAIFIPPNSSAAISAVPPHCRGVAAGTMATARNLGMVVGVTQANAIFSGIFSFLSGGLALKGYTPQFAQPFIQAFSYAMAAGALVAACGAVAAALRGREIVPARATIGSTGIESELS